MTKEVEPETDERGNVKINFEEWWEYHFGKNLEKMDPSLPCWRGELVPLRERKPSRREKRTPSKGTQIDNKDSL